VGDFNVAAEKRDVHDAINWDTLYQPSELAALKQLLSSLTDMWRRLHLDTSDVYTVWNERTSARAFNVVCSSFRAVQCNNGRQGLRRHM